jgi:hypothetical protein
MDKTGVWLDVFVVIGTGIAGYFSLYLNVNDKWPISAKILRRTVAILFVLFVFMHDYFMKKSLFEVIRDRIGDNLCYLYPIESCPAEIRELAAREKAERDAWAAAVRVNTIPAYEGYLLDFGELEKTRSAEARKRILALQGEERRRADDEAWESATRKNTIAAYQSYLSEFQSRDGAHLEEASRRIREEIAWPQVLTQNTIPAFKEFVSSFAKGEHVKEARQRLAELEESERRRLDEAEWAKAKHDDTISGYIKYLAAAGKNNGAHAKEARDRLAYLQEMARLQRLDDEAWAAAVRENTAIAYNRYILAFEPRRGTHLAEAKERLAKLRPAETIPVPVIEKKPNVYDGSDPRIGSNGQDRIGEQDLAHENYIFAMSLFFDLAICSCLFVLGWRLGLKAYLWILLPYVIIYLLW